MSSASQQADARLAGNTLVTAGAQVVVMGLGAVLAVVVLVAFGTTAATDGLFAAYGVYGVILMVAQSLRTTVVARLVESADFWRAFDAYLVALLALVGAAAIVLIGLSGPASTALTGDGSGDAHDAARYALVLLTVSGAAQLVAALAAAALGALDRFAPASVAYLAGGLSSIVLLLALVAPLDEHAVALAVTVGSLVNVTLMLRALRAAGWHGHGSAAGAADAGADVAIPTLRERIGLVILGAAVYAGSQSMFVVSVALAARIGPGAATVYTYAYFAAAFVAGVSSGSVGMVLAAPLAQTWDRQPRSLLPHLRTIVRLGATLIAPVVAVVALAGDDLVATLLSGVLTEEDGRDVAATFVALGGYTVGMLALTVPLLAAFALGRYHAVAAVSAVVLLVHLGVSALAVEADSLALLAGVASASTLAVFAGLVLVVFGRASGAAAVAVLDELLRPVALAAVVFGLAGLAASALGGHAAPIALAALAAVVYGAAVRVLLPEQWALVARLLAPLAALRAR